LRSPNGGCSWTPRALTDGFHSALQEIRKDWDEQVKKSLRKKHPGKKEDDKS